MDKNKRLESKTKIIQSLIWYQEKLDFIVKNNNEKERNKEYAKISREFEGILARIKVELWN